MHIYQGFLTCESKLIAVLSVDLGFFFLSCTIFIVLQGGILGVSCALLSSRVGCCLLSAFVIVYIVIVCLPCQS